MEVTTDLDTYKESPVVSALAEALEQAREVKSVHWKFYNAPGSPGFDFYCRIASNNSASLSELKEELHRALRGKATFHLCGSWLYARPTFEDLY